MDKQESDNLESDNLESDKLKSDKQLELILKWAGAVVLTKHCWARSDTNWGRSFCSTDCLKNLSARGQCYYFGQCLCHFFFSKWWNVFKNLIILLVWKTLKNLTCRSVGMYVHTYSLLCVKSKIVQKHLSPIGTICTVQSSALVKTYF
jgi:hypothetical protein